MKRTVKLFVIFTAYLLVQCFVTCATIKLSAKGLTKDVETVFGWTNEECNEKVQNLQKLNVYCTRARIIRIDLGESAEHWIAHVEKYGYKQTEVEPEFSYYYFTDNSLFAYRWEYEGTITDYATLCIGAHWYYFERRINK